MKILLGWLGIVLFELALSGASYGDLPDQITVTAKYVNPSSPVILEDGDGSVVTTFMGTIQVTHFSFNPNDFLNLKKAKTKEFIHPLLGGCVLLDYSFDFLGPTSSLISMGGRDSEGQIACQIFMTTVADGFQMKFTDVPLLNRGGVIKTVHLKVN